MSKKSVTPTEKVTVSLSKTKVAVLSILPFDGDIDTESLFQIDHSNLIGEILTFPVAFNRIANMRAEAANYLATEQFEFEVLSSQLYKDYKRKEDALASTTRGASIKDVEMAMLRDAGYKAAKQKLLNRQKDFDIVDALYWSAQSKDRKLNVLSEKIRPDDFEKEIVEGVINGIMIRKRKKAIPDP